MQTNNIGNKIRIFRKRAGMSQLDLEVAIDASNGMISRIETGDVNPTKETIFKIAEALKLNGIETAELFGIKTISIQPTAETLNENHPDLSKILELTTSSWVKLLGVNYATVWLWDAESQQLRLESVTAPKTALTLATTAMGKNYQGLILSNSNKDQVESDYLKCLGREKILISNDFSTIAHSFINKDLARIIQKVLNMNLTITIPLIFEEKKLGVLGLIWQKETLSDQDRMMVDTFAQQISVTIYNALKLTKMSV
jgi:transcriptional regulator with XRE-family HTH domain